MIIVVFGAIIGLLSDLDLDSQYSLDLEKGVSLLQCACVVALYRLSPALLQKGGAFM